MTVVRTAIANCDDDCGADQVVDAQSTQVFRDLGEMGWTTEATDDEILTFCPYHSTPLMERRRAQKRGDLLCTLCVELGLEHDGDHLIPTTKES